MIYSLVGGTYDHGAWSGVPRFDFTLRKVFPEMRTITGPCPELAPDDVVIADNHLSLRVPRQNRCVIVHHGCAQTHYDRDPAWRGPQARQMVQWQRAMFGLPNRTFVSPSGWTAVQFSHVAPRGFDYFCKLIPHWVEPMERPNRPECPVIIGDWRDYNKGAAMWKRLAKVCADWEFEPLFFRTEDDKQRQYGNASLYLCLSLSEGGSYSMCDAEAAGLPIVTTDVGNYREFTDCEVIPWQERDNLEIVIAAIELKLARGREKPSFYRDYAFENWKTAWESVIRQDPSR